jgi:hypothetical protein
MFTPHMLANHIMGRDWRYRVLVKAAVSLFPVGAEGKTP